MFWNFIQKKFKKKIKNIKKKFWMNKQKYNRKNKRNEIYIKMI